MTDTDRFLWQSWAAMLQDANKKILEHEKELAATRAHVEDLRLRMRCLEQGVKFEDIPK